jgi:hypothetical protein
MQSSTAEKLRQDWGNAFCYHPMFDREYKSNEYTGNHVCLICGEPLTEEEYKKITQERNQQENSDDFQ